MTSTGSAGVLVTGSTGFIGARLVRRLLADGSFGRVVGLVRSEAKAAALVAAGMEVALGDVTDPESLVRAARGTEVVFHLAAITRAARVRTFDRVHVEGTRNVLGAARQSGARRVVNVASQAVLFDGNDLVDADESWPYPTRFLDPYSRTKAEAEKLALDANGRGTVETTSLRPSWVWGAGDTTVLPNFVGLARGWGIPLPGGGEREESTAHVENVVDALVLAARAPTAAGRAYFITDGFSVTTREFLARQIRALGIEPVVRAIPLWIARSMAWCMDVPPSWVGLPVKLARLGVTMFATNRRFRIDRARRELGYEPRIGLDEGIEEIRRVSASTTNTGSENT